ncbi:hypothetical protein [Actinomadura harenae]|uniref:Uncharacterized protein n=1 Tax=Actinomadura harenae TaxID=2483351 RepID=A0A3M2LQR9_9ACTN|nr:hypothetical protein [Actinomadura harenae]RMI39642.1 hypothetical protein EBO15_29190 [Actinomadura harenae]
MGGPEQPGESDQGRTLWCAIGEGALGGLLAALLALSFWYLIPVPPPTAAERWLAVIATALLGGIASATGTVRRKPR